MKIETKDFTVEFPDDQATKDAVFNAVVNFYKEQELFSGESIMQSDAGLIESPVFLATMADDIFKFNVKYKDE